MYSLLAFHGQWANEGPAQLLIQNAVNKGDKPCWIHCPQFSAGDAYRQTSTAVGFTRTFVDFGCDVRLLEGEGTVQNMKQLPLYTQPVISFGGVWTITVVGFLSYLPV